MYQLRAGGSCVAGAALMVMLLAGCTPTSPSEQGTTTNSSAPDVFSSADGSTSTGSTTSAGDEVTWRDSPFTQYWTGGVMPSETSEQEANEEWVTLETKKQEIVAQCMTDQGFEYTISTPTLSVNASNDGSADVAWEPDDQAWVAEHGYGIVNNPWNDVLYAPQTAAPSPEPTSDDPNAQWLATRSAAEQQAFLDALYGHPQLEPGAEEGNATFDWKTMGCQGKADHQVEKQTDSVYNEYSDLIAAMGQLSNSLDDSVEMEPLDKKWSTCMSSAGFSYDKQPEPEKQIKEELTALYASVGTAPTDGSNPLADNDQAIKLGQQEIKVALADLACRNELNYAQEKLKVQYTREEKFIADNKGDLDKFKAALEQVDH